jgi:hypothetical protein
MKVAHGHFVHAHRQHWSIEGYHRAIKQLCHAEKFFVRWKRAIGNHIFCALRAFLKLEETRSRGLIASWYELKRHLIDQAVGDFIHQMAGQHSA